MELSCDNYMDSKPEYLGKMSIDFYEDKTMKYEFSNDGKPNPLNGNGVWEKLTEQPRYKITFSDNSELLPTEIYKMGGTGGTSIYQSTGRSDFKIIKEIEVPEA